MKQHLRATSLLFNQPLLVTPDMLDLGVRWANQAMSLNIVNLSMGGLSSLPTDTKLFYDEDDYEQRAVEKEDQTGHTFRSPGRDTQPSGLIQLRTKFEQGYIPRGDTDQLTMFDEPEFRKCRVCSL